MCTRAPMAIVGKNTLVIMLQLYRLYVVQAENRKAQRQLRRMGAAAPQKKQRRRRSSDRNELNDIYTITKGRSGNNRRKKR